MSTIDRFYVLCFTVLSALGIGYLLTHPVPRPDVLAMARQVDSLRQSADSARTMALQTQYESKAASQRERKAADRLTSQLRTMRDSLAHLRDLPLDTTASADTLRIALAVALATADTLADRAEAYLAEVDSLRDRYAEERRAMTVALDKADTVMAHQDALIRALQKQECRVFGRPCPTRSTIATVALLTGLVTGAILTK
jgi:hypothetical protein